MQVVSRAASILRALDSKHAASACPSSGSGRASHARPYTGS